MKESDLELIDNHNAQLVHNPSSNANNRVGLTPNQSIQILVNQDI